MTKLASLALAVTALALAGCGSSESAKEQAQPENVEMPAEEAVGDIDATPAADAAAEPGADATTAAEVPAPATKP